MSRHSRQRLALVATVTLAVLLAACGGNKKVEEQRARRAAAIVPPTIVPLPSDTPAPTDTPEAVAPVVTASASGAMTTTGQAQLPRDKAAPIVQIARIEPRASEPGLLAEMAPEFSLNADGVAVFQALQGPSKTNWYQTAITTEQAQKFLSLLVDEIGVLRLAEGRGVKDAVDLSRDAAGNPRGPEALGVVYVRTADKEGRLVLTAADLASTDPGIQRLTALLIALENWKSGVSRTIPPEVVPLVTQNLGWWSDLRQEWTPQTVVAWGTKAGSPVPRAAVAKWPLKVDPGTLFQAAAGESPDFAVFGGEDAAALLQAQIDAGLDPEYPLWRFPGSDQVYVIGLRANPPGGNHEWVPYRFAAAPAAATAASTTGGPATAVPGSASGRPTAVATATAKP
jgi:hypothetical protein